MHNRGVVFRRMGNGVFLPRAADYKREAIFYILNAYLILSNIL